MKRSSAPTPPSMTAEPAVIDLTGDDHHVQVLADIVRAMADTGIRVDTDIEAASVADTVRQPLQEPLPPPLAPQMLTVGFRTRSSPRGPDLTAAVIELARHLIASTLRNGRPPDLMAEVVSRALDHFHPAAMIAALEAEDRIRALLDRLVEPA